MRRLVIYANDGFILSYFDKDGDFREELIAEGPTFAEMKFDGTTVHRFRPLNEGRFFAYSIHYKDLSDDEEALGKQTTIYEGKIPEKVKVYKI